MPINTYGAGDQSGTYEFFADATFNGDIAESFPFCNMTEAQHSATEEKAACRSSQNYYRQSCYS